MKNKKTSKKKKESTTEITWELYEQITKYVYEQLGKEKGVTIECYGNKCSVKGKSNVKHQVDVLTKFSDGVHNYRTAIECKYWNKKVNKDIVMKVARLIEDAGIEKGVIVTQKGFTKDAVKTAKYSNIGLIELRVPTENDWKGRVKNISIELNLLIPQILKIQVITPDTTLNQTEQEIIISLIDIKHPDGTVDNISKYYTEFQNELNEKKEGEEIEKVFMFESGTVLINGQTENEIPVNGLRFRGILKIEKNVVEIRGEDHVYMIMKTHFENKYHTISKDGVIHEKHSSQNEKSE